MADGWPSPLTDAGGRRAPRSDTHAGCRISLSLLDWARPALPSADSLTAAALLYGSRFQVSALRYPPAAHMAGDGGPQYRGGFLLQRGDWLRVISGDSCPYHGDGEAPADTATPAPVRPWQEWIGPVETTLHVDDSFFVLTPHGWYAISDGDRDHAAVVPDVTMSQWHEDGWDNWLDPRRRQRQRGELSDLFGEAAHDRSPLQYFGGQQFFVDSGSLMRWTYMQHRFNDLWVVANASLGMTGRAAEDVDLRDLPLPLMLPALDDFWAACTHIQPRIRGSIGSFFGKIPGLLKVCGGQVVCVGELRNIEIAVDGILATRILKPKDIPLAYFLVAGSEPFVNALRKKNILVGADGCILLEGDYVLMLGGNFYEMGVLRMVGDVSSMFFDTGWAVEDYGAVVHILHSGVELVASAVQLVAYMRGTHATYHTPYGTVHAASHWVRPRGRPIDISKVRCGFRVRLVRAQTRIRRLLSRRRGLDGVYYLPRYLGRLWRPYRTYDDLERPDTELQNVVPARPVPPRGGAVQTQRQRLRLPTARPDHDLCYRPCVNCGRRTANGCRTWWQRGYIFDQGHQCLAIERIPSETWGSEQWTPLCTSCEDISGACRFCRGITGCAAPPWGRALPVTDHT